MNMSRILSSVSIAVVLLLLLFLPVLIGGRMIYSACVIIAIFAVMAYGLDIIVSDLGEVSLAHPVFFATGAYVTALMTAQAGFDPITSLVATIIVTLAIAAVIALVTLRLREFVFSLVTYSVTVVGVTVASSWAFLGGSNGISGIPLFEVFGYRARTNVELWPIAWLLLVSVIWIVAAFRRSRLGHAVMTVHLNSELATMSGVSPTKVRMQVFLVSAPITASAGWLYAYQRAYVSSDVLSTYFLILMLTAVVLVGRRLLLAPLIGVALIILQERFLSYGANVNSIVLGTILILVLSFLPGGLAGLLAEFMRRLRPGTRANASREST